jgi:Ca2+-binding EF-hand superfamily protein
MSVVSIHNRLSEWPPQQAASAQPASARGEAGQGSMDMPTADERQLHETLDRMALYTRRTRLQIQPFFASFDKHKQGAISWTQFARVLATVGFTALTHELVENLSRHYSLTNDPTKVSWKAFVNDLNTIVQEQQKQAHDQVQRAQSGPTMEYEAATAHNPLIKREEEKAAYGSTRQHFQTLHDIHSESPLTAQKILHKIQTICQQKRIILSDIFADYDTLRKNLITLQRFRRCLDVAGFQLSDAEANILVGQYLNERDSNMVEYKAFIADVLKPFIPPNPETSPLSQQVPFLPYRLETEETPLPRFTEEEKDRIEFLLKELGYQTHTRRILIKPGFQHHDSTRSGCVTARQFASVVTATFPFRFQPRDLDLLAAKYRRGSIGIHYISFLKEVEQHELGANEYAKTLHPSHAASHLAQSHGPAPMQPVQKQGAQVIAGMKIIPTRAAFEEQERAAFASADLQQVLGGIRETLQKKRMDIADIFIDFDPLRKGRVTQTQFFRCLTNQGLKLSPAHVRLLTESYPHPEIKEEVDWRKFVGDLSTVPKF